MIAPFPHGHALLIGVGDIPAARWWSLPETVEDIRAIRAILVDPERCGYPADEDHLRVLHDERATGAAILEGLGWLSKRTAADPEATAIIYYSGHGVTHGPDGRYYLVPHDADPTRVPDSFVAAEQFADALRLVASRRLLVILDCCHAQAMATAKVPRDLRK